MPAVPGWYGDSHGHFEQRFWDGAVWTSEVRSAGVDDVSLPDSPPRIFAFTKGDRRPPRPAECRRAGGSCGRPRRHQHVGGTLQRGAGWGGRGGLALSASPQLTNTMAATPGEGGTRSRPGAATGAQQKPTPRLRRVRGPRNHLRGPETRSVHRARSLGTADRDRGVDRRGCPYRFGGERVGNLHRRHRCLAPAPASPASAL